jgi:hypothetical protein
VRAVAASVPIATTTSDGRVVRRDTWWTRPVATSIGLGAFAVYATWAALQSAHYHFGPYLSPFYSPELFGESQHAWFGSKPAWWPAWLGFSPAILILWAPGGFRFTCYYYRGAYYKSFAAHPLACAMREGHRGYRGETRFPLVLQNLHRYFLYLALPFIVILSIDAWKAFWFTDPATGHTTFGIGLGTLVLVTNTILLACYTLGCHSLRHLVGGGLDRLAGRPLRRHAYAGVSCLNQRHMKFAWASLFSVGFADLYVRLCAMGIWSDWRIL